MVEGCQGAHSSNPAQTEEKAAEHTRRGQQACQGTSRPLTRNSQVTHIIGELLSDLPKPPPDAWAEQDHPASRLQPKETLHPRLRQRPLPTTARRCKRGAGRRRAWASGGIVCTPADLNDFIRGYVGRSSSTSGRGRSSAGVWKEEALSRPVRGRTRPASPSSATRRVARRCGATRASVL
jgi:hypothetical protein